MANTDDDATPHRIQVGADLLTVQRSPRLGLIGIHVEITGAAPAATQASLDATGSLWLPPWAARELATALLAQVGDGTDAPA